MPGIFIVQGWSETARTAVEMVVAAADGEAARARARSDGLTAVTVRPYAPVDPTLAALPKGNEQAGAPALGDPRQRPSGHAGRPGEGT